MRRLFSDLASVNKTAKTAFLSAVALIAVSQLTAPAAAAGPDFVAPIAVPSSVATAPAPQNKSISVPMFFEPNQGQTDPRVKFLAHGAGYGLFLTSDEVVLELRPTSGIDQPGPVGKQSAVIQMHLAGANQAAEVSGAEPLPGKSSYFIGNDSSKWRSGIPQFGRVEYRSVYPGINLVYYGNQGQLEYDFHVAPGADPKQIALTFNGADVRIDSSATGDLVLSTPNGEVRFHAPRVYQPTVDGEKEIVGNFQRLTGNKIGFAIGPYDHNRELVIDPTLGYSTYIGGTGTEGLVKIAVDSSGYIYLAGSTNSTNFPINLSNPPQAPLAETLAASGATNIFVAVLNISQSGTSQLVFSAYLGGSGTDNLAGVAVDTAQGIYVAGTTTSSDFPTVNGLPATVGGGIPHGFLSRMVSNSFVYTLADSTYLAGNGSDTVTGLAIDQSCGTQVCNAYVMGNTTSSNEASSTAPFPASPNGMQLVSNSPGNPQFFASKINVPSPSGPLNMIYSTYFGGGYPVAAIATGGGIAVDASGNMYITGTTNMLNSGIPSGSGFAPFPLVNAQQSCLNQASTNTNCINQVPTTITDGFVAKINPLSFGQPPANPVYSTYVGGSGTDTVTAIAVDSSSAAYITGATSSNDWKCSGCGVAFQSSYGGGPTDAYVAKIGNLNGTIYPFAYFTYLGGLGADIGNDIKVDSVSTAHVAGFTTSSNIPLLPPSVGGGGDAFVALISTGGIGTGNYFEYFGGSLLDQGTGIALDINSQAYVAGSTLSANFPVSANPYRGTLNGTAADAFVTQILSKSSVTIANATNSPSPNPASSGVPVQFIFNINNSGPDPASNVSFVATPSPSGLSTSTTTATVSTGGTCTPLQPVVNTISCTIPTLAACSGVCSGAQVIVNATPPIAANLNSLTMSAQVSANGGGLSAPASQTVPVVDFTVQASTPSPVTAGGLITINVNFCPNNNGLGYNGTITPSQTILPSMVTASSPVYNPTTVQLNGTACASTVLSIQTVARPVTIGALLHRASFYAAWLPIGGLSLIGFGLGATGRRRRWLLGTVLALIAGIVVLQSACGSSSTSTVTQTGTAAGNYTVSVGGSAGTGASHNISVGVRVN